MYTALTIAGSDPSGGAGIQADIKTMTCNGVYAMSVITSITAQNTIGVSSIFDIPSDYIKNQIDSIFTDIFPNAVKIGMLGSPDSVDTIASALNYYNAKNMVVDPVMVSTSGSSLISDSTRTQLVKRLLPIATLITPNIPEAEILSGREIKSLDDMTCVAKELSANLYTSVLVKGGHSSTFTSNNSSAVDVLVRPNTEPIFFNTIFIDNPNTHGTGCTLSSAIASNLAKGLSVEIAVKKAKDYVTNAIKSGLNLGHGRGPLNHMQNIIIKETL